MSNDKHTAEPWKHVETQVYLGNEGGFDIRGCPTPEANARRIVACVNACAGIETEKLEAIDYAQLMGQRDRLLEQLRFWAMDADSLALIAEIEAEIEAAK